MLYRRFFKHNGRDFKKQIVVPKHLREELLYRLHHAPTQAHLGVGTVQLEFREKFYYPIHQEDIEKYIRNCITCAQTKPVPGNQLKPAMMGVSMQTAFPGDMMQLDLPGMFTSSNGYAHILTGIDVFSKYLFAVPLRRITSRAVMEALTKILLTDSYIPAQIITDQGRQFISQLTHETMTLFDIDLKHASVKHPQTIGLLERAHARIKQTLKTMEKQGHVDWDKAIDYAVFAHNTRIHKDTRSTPAEMFRGMPPVKALDMRFGVNDLSARDNTFETTNVLKDKLMTLWPTQQDSLVKNYIKNKEYFEMNAKAQPLKLHSYCLILNPALETQTQMMNRMDCK